MTPVYAVLSVPPNVIPGLVPEKLIANIGLSRAPWVTRVCGTEEALPTAIAEHASPSTPSGGVA